MLKNGGDVHQSRNGQVGTTWDIRQVVLTKILVIKSNDKLGHSSKIMTCPTSIIKIGDTQEIMEKWTPGTGQWSLLTVIVIMMYCNMSQLK